MIGLLKKELDKIVALSRKSTLCISYESNIVSISFKIVDELEITEQSTEESFSIWTPNMEISTPNSIQIKYCDIVDVEYLSCVSKPESDGVIPMDVLTIKLKDGSRVDIFEDVA